ncbi:ATP-binding cassette domain-containing protein [Nocardia sp. R6R-6]|uniref:ATP-binding cassette domain-containing protein n=1 Tax=Nocardia sp. R6R-6 TaxID=3459303 RepID=UPI00403E1728
MKTRNVSRTTLLGDLRQMWALLELSRWRVALAITWGVLALGSALGLAALAAWLIARAWQMPPVLDLSVAVVAVRALGIARGLCRYLERLATHDVALRAMTTARTTVYRTLARSDFWLRRPEPSGGDTGGSSSRHRNSGGSAAPRRGDLLVRVGSDIDDLGAVVVRVFVPVAVAAVLSVAAVGLLATISVDAAVILAGALALSGVVAPWLSAKAAREAERAVRADRAEFTAQALTVLDHAAELRVAGRLGGALDAAADTARRAVAAEDTAASHSAWSAAATPLSIGASVFGALLLGITLYGPDGGTIGAMTPMALTVLVLLPLSAFEAVGPLPAAAQALTTARAALHRITGAAGRSPAPEPRRAEPRRTDKGPMPARSPRRAEQGQRSASRSGIEDDSATNAAMTLTRTDSGVQPGPDTSVTRTDATADGAGPHDAAHGLGATPKPMAVSGPAIGARAPELPQGRRIAVVGPSGAGKTTLLMAWAGLFDTPRPGVTFFAEDAHLFSTSVLENLRVARGDLTEVEAENAVRTAGLGDWLDGLPEGVHTDLIGGAAAVSGGQRRRILLARALVSSAQVLLLDEPTEHLEAEAGARLLRELLDADSGLVEPDRIVVVVTHQLPQDHRADVVLRIDVTGQVTTDFAAEGARRAASVCAHREIPLPTS